MFRSRRIVSVRGRNRGAASRAARSRYSPRSRRPTSQSGQRIRVEYYVRLHRLVANVPLQSPAAARCPTGVLRNLDLRLLAFQGFRLRLLVQLGTGGQPAAASTMRAVITLFSF